jgi:hypothetical protein
MAPQLPPKLLDTEGGASDVISFLTTRDGQLWMHYNSAVTALLLQK